MTPVLGSVVIPAHDEQAVIGRCLEALHRGLEPGDLEVVVVCNGCTDATADVARGFGRGVRVLELTAASKPAALRRGEASVQALPRLYLDADVALPGAAARRVLERLRDGALAARPPIRYDTRTACPPVRSYYRARRQLPAVLGSLWGAGVCGVSARGRARFDDFPDLVSDDLWLDRRFEPREIEVVDCEPVVVMVPRRVTDLLRVLRRTYRGKREHVSDGAADARARAMTASAAHDLRRLARSGPRGAVDALTYAAFAVGGRLALAIHPPGRAPQRWERDDSSRAA